MVTHTADGNAARALRRGGGAEGRRISKHPPCASFRCVPSLPLEKKMPFVMKAIFFGTFAPLVAFIVFIAARRCSGRSLKSTEDFRLP